MPACQCVPKAQTKCRDSVSYRMRARVCVCVCVTRRPTRETNLKKTVPTFRYGNRRNVRAGSEKVPNKRRGDLKRCARRRAGLGGAGRREWVP